MKNRYRLFRRGQDPAEHASGSDLSFLLGEIVQA